METFNDLYSKPCSLKVTESEVIHAENARSTHEETKEHSKF